MLLFASGCQCWGWGEAYSQKVDEIADHPFVLDHLYRPEHDLTRIGHPDWCCSECNQNWCPGGCSRCR